MFNLLKKKQSKHDSCCQIKIEEVKDDCCKEGEKEAAKK